ncbi:MAG: hypothetical protein U0U70_15635 [Chitinophagaceae bacterium]
MTMHLVHWKYTQKEWKQFQHWKSRRKGLLSVIAGWLWPFRRQKPDEVRILPDRICINKNQEPFQNAQRCLHAVNIRESGSFNLLEISYREGRNIRNISIPVPKGKLREAFDLQARLAGK